MTEDAKPARPLDRVLQLFSRVEPGETKVVLLMTLNIFLFLLAYYIIKVVREPLILAIEPQTFLGVKLPGGAELKSYGAAGQALVLMVFVPFYSWFSSRVARRPLVIGLILFFLSNIIAFSFAITLHPLVGFAFFIWVGIFSLSIIAQFWSYANDIYTKEQGDRLFPLIGVGMVAGPPIGSKLAGELFDRGVGESTIMYVSAGVLLLHLALFLIIDRSTSSVGAVEKKDETLEGSNGFALIFQSRYLLLIAALMLVLNIVNTTGEFILGDTVKAAAREALAGGDQKAFIGSFYGDFYFVVNVVAILLQALFVSRLVKYTGIRGVVLMLPIIALGSYALIGVGVGLTLLRWAKTAENATDYSVMNTGRSMLWLPTTRAEKYKGKQAIDTFVVRLGDVFSAILVGYGLNVLALGGREFALVNLGFVALWLLVAFALLREHRRIAPEPVEAESA